MLSVRSGDIPFSNDFIIPHRIYAGFSYRMPWSQHAATSLSALYQGSGMDKSIWSNAYPAPKKIVWIHGIEARLSQDIIFPAGSRDHTLQLTVYYRGNIDRSHYLLAGLRYSL